MDIMSKMYSQLVDSIVRQFKDLFNIIIYLRIIMLVLIRNGLIDCLIIVSEFGKKIFIII